jgi:hypothetical protein
LIAVGVIIAFIATTNIQGIAQADLISACKKKDGIIRIVQSLDECKKTEEPLSWNETGPSGPPGSTGEKGEVGPPSGPKVLDALGNFVGYLVTYDQWGDLIWNPEHQVFMHITRGGSFHSPQFMYFLEENCSETQGIYIQWLNRTVSPLRILSPTRIW